MKRFVFKIALKYKAVDGVEMEDLKQEGFICMEAAARSYDRDQGHFAPMLALSVRHGLWRYIQKSCGTCHIPEGLLYKAAITSKYKAEQIAQTGKAPTPKEIREALDLTAAEYRAIEKANQAKQSQSIYETLPGTEGMTLADTIEDDHRPQEEVEADIDRQRMTDHLWKAIEERGAGDLFRERYKNGRTRKETAELLGMTEKEVRNAEWRTMEALRGSLQLKQYYYSDSKLYNFSSFGFFKNNGSGVEVLALGLF